MKLNKILTMLALMLSATGCGASNTKASDGVDTTATQADDIPQTALMITENIPAGSKKVEVETTAGNFTLLLYGDTPGHRDNFLKHVADGTYDGVLFHRVIKDFMVQAGDPESKNAQPGQMLGAGQAGDPIPAEIVYPRHFHKRGALAAARQGDQVNPERKSSASQFYVVTGKKFSAGQLDQMEMQIKHQMAQQHFNELAQAHMDEIRRMQTERDTTGLRNLQMQLTDETNQWAAKQDLGMTAEMRQAYQTIGGTPHLDNQYTVYGEVIDGMDVIDKIQNVATGPQDRPIEDVKIISMKVLDD